MRERDEQAFQRKKAEIMEACFNCYAENGLTGTGIQALADACGLSKASLYTYFDTLDDLIVQSTAYCMSKVEDDFMRLAPTVHRRGALLDGKASRQKIPADVSGLHAPQIH